MRHRTPLVLVCAIFGFIAAGPTRAFTAEKTLKELLVEKGAITKEEAATIQETVLAKWIDRLTVYGDLRVRNESIWYSADPGTGDNGDNRHRPRFRLRLGTQLKIKDLLVAVQLASGTGDATGNNQSFDNFNSQKAIWIQQAYLSWNPSGARWVTLAAGKMENPFFTVETSDIVWDADVAPEGVAETLRFRAGDTVMLFFNAAQIVLDEDGGDDHDQWLIGQQLGATVEPNDRLKATVAAAFYEVLNATTGTFGQTLVQDGNSRGACPGVVPPVATCLVNRYHIIDLTAALNTRVGPLPLAIMGDYVRNLADTTTGGNGVGAATGNVGYQVGMILGKASDPNTWELAYLYKVAETDAALADMADSDFGDGGLSRRGHIAWIAYNPTKYFQAKTKLLVTESDGALKDDITKLQVDASVKF
ncbi:MAG: putative porin [Nitrospirota bacterium]